MNDKAKKSGRKFVAARNFSYLSTRTAFWPLPSAEARKKPPALYLDFILCFLVIIPVDNREYSY